MSSMRGLVCALALTMTAAESTIMFNTTFGDHMVLQRGPSKAAVYGTLLNASGAVSGKGAGKVSIRVDEMGGASYTVEAVVADGQWKAFLKPAPAGGNYTIYADCDGCSAGTNISDVTFGDVWYCSGQSNMWLPLQYTFHRNQTVADIESGKYSNIRLFCGDSQRRDFTWLTTSLAVADGNQSVPSYSLFEFSAACYYFAESLTDQMVQAGETPPPLGLINTAIGGTMIEAWSTNTTTKSCKNYTDIGPAMQGLWDTDVLPYVNMTVKGFLWYQGENNCHGFMGNSLEKTGYGCQMPAMMKLWREVWSTEPGTTDPQAPFGIVSLAAGGSEGGSDIGGMRWSQSANYGVMPNPDMPNAFMAHAYDLGDPWPSKACYGRGCCNPGANTSACTDCVEYCSVLHSTNYFMGPIHPRLKKPLGERLATAARVVAYGAKGPATGPTISGCRVDTKARTLALSFNPDLSAGDGVTVNQYNRTANQSSLRVLLNASLWCMQAVSINRTVQCVDHGPPALRRAAAVQAEDQSLFYRCFGLYAEETGRAMALPGATIPERPPFPRECWGMQIDGIPRGARGGDGMGLGGLSPYDDPMVWVPVNISAGSDAFTVVGDLSFLAGAPIFGVRYAWGNVQDSCCREGDDLGVTRTCPPGSCPIHGKVSGLPANPFMARVRKDGTCECVAPQKCG